MHPLDAFLSCIRICVFSSNLSSPFCLPPTNSSGCVMFPLGEERCHLSGPTTELSPIQTPPKKGDWTLPFFPWEIPFCFHIFLLSMVPIFRTRDSISNISIFCDRGPRREGRILTCSRILRKEEEKKEKRRILGKKCSVRGGGGRRGRPFLSSFLRGGASFLHF